ncbi:Protein TIFY 10B [Platanthera zijinensis]|uniref:Protein TIFY n=1 Tax=Platanthera zijinensis TaxID=2320716 RepID=A0AAP0B0J7_9ASPA
MEGFSEMVKLPEKSNFFLTCNLLSQYIKEKGCPADLGFGMPPRAFDRSAIGKQEACRRPTTMRLLPDLDFAGDENAGVNDDAVAPSSKRSTEQCPPQITGSFPSANSPEKSQLTIFYGGKVLVLENFPAEKAEALMLLASNLHKFSFSPPTATADQPISPSPVYPPANFSSLPKPKFSDLPIARKASLHRFLEKRKERINGKWPYQMSFSEGANGSVSAKLEDKSSQPWLGLGPQSLNSSV